MKDRYDRQRMDQQQEMMNDQELADKQVLNRVLQRETTYGDYVYLLGRLNLAKK